MRRSQTQLLINLILTLFFTQSAFADLIPTSEGDNSLYYKIGGGSNYALPPIQQTNSINLDADADLSSGYSCGMFNPLAAIKNTFNSFKDSADNIEQSTISNMTGAVTEFPMYALAKADKNLYDLINNTRLGADNKLDVTTKTCQQVKDQISQGKNPYEDWGTIAVNNQWKKSLSLTANDPNQDINQLKQHIDNNKGNDGVPWVTKAGDGQYVAGGVNQPPIHVISDTVGAGYNALITPLGSTPNLSAHTSAPIGSELANYFPTSISAQNWIVNVVGDQNVTTCLPGSPGCNTQNGGTAGRGLLPQIQPMADIIRGNLGDIVTGKTQETNENLTAVSADGIMVSPQLISAIRAMDTTQQGIVVNKLAQEIATQKTIDEAFIAKNILQTGSQIPVIASNHPALTTINQAIETLDKDIQSLSFESQIRKQMTSNTISNILASQQGAEQAAANIPKASTPAPFLNNGAVSTQTQTKQR